MQVHCDEGIANHIGPEPCAGAREDVGEASVGERIGQPLSLENIFPLGADAEPPRVLRRLQHLREWSHEQVEQVSPGSP